MNYTKEMADMNDIALILQLYFERMQCFEDNNIKQWSKYLINHTKSEFEEAINNKYFYIILKDNEIIAGFELSEDSRE